MSGKQPEHRASRLKVLYCLNCGGPAQHGGDFVGKDRIKTGEIYVVCEDKENCGYACMKCPDGGHRPLRNGYKKRKKPACYFLLSAFRRRPTGPRMELAHQLYKPAQSLKDRHWQDPDRG